MVTAVKGLLSNPALLIEIFIVFYYTIQKISITCYTLLKK